MPFVVDASITASWLFEDERSPETDAVLTDLRFDEAHVPAIYPTEVANTILTGMKKRRVTEQGAANFLRLLDTLSFNLQAAQFSPQSILADALAHNLTAYDATYLSLSLRLGLPIATLDNEIRNVAVSLGVPLLPAKLPMRNERR